MSEAALRRRLERVEGELARLRAARPSPSPYDVSPEGWARGEERLMGCNEQSQRRRDAVFNAMDEDPCSQRWWPC